MSTPLGDIRLLDATSGIAGAYCGRLFADAGALVTKLVLSDPARPRQETDARLFRFLDEGKRVVSGDDVVALAAGADVVVVEEPTLVAPLRATHPALVVVSITPFGCDGPYAGMPANEFTLQAHCGSSGYRGLPTEPPLSAGGRLGEWITGSYAAVAALVARRHAVATGAGEHVDVAMLDCMTSSMTTLRSVFYSFGDRPLGAAHRTTEVPSVEPTADGFVTFTANSAQQLSDFCAMIGAPELLEDESLSRAPTRFQKRDTFLPVVHRWTTARPSAEVLEMAAMYRVPASPVLHAAEVLGFEQFVERGVFEPDRSGEFVRPRVPYRATLAEAPAAPPGPSARPAAPGSRPLSGLRVIDFTAWWAGPAATQVLACLGADVVKVESVRRPDQVRFATGKGRDDASWWEWGAVFHGVNHSKRGITLDLASEEGREAFLALAASADLLIENYTPRVLDQLRLGAPELHAANPRLVVVRMPAFGLGGPWRDRPGFAQTMESVTGLAWTTGWEDGPPVLPRGLCDPFAGNHAAFAGLVAIAAREADGRGRLIEAPMVESALRAAAEQVIECSATGRVMHRMGNRSPRDAPQGTYRCRGEDEWVSVSVTSDDQWVALRAALGDPEWARDPSFTGVDGRRAAHDAIDAGITAWTCGREAEDAAFVLLAAGVPAGRVVSPFLTDHHPQLVHRGFYEVEHHRITGDHPMPGMPFRFTSVDRWMTCPSPTLGEHTDEILAELGYSGDELEALRGKGVIGTELAT